MVIKLNYRGVLITAKQYRLIANEIVNKNFIHFSMPTAKEQQSEYLDKLWFRLGYDSSINIIVTNENHSVLHKLVLSGLVKDLREEILPTCEGGVYDLLHEVLYGKNTRIKLCNDIRTILAKLAPHRWCGAEAESLFHPLIYANATEICGNTPPGEYFNTASGLMGRMPIPMHEEHLRELYSDFNESFNDPGQKKLGLIMCAVPINGLDIIYVGGSPGDAWMRALRKRGYEGKIICIDPAPLSSSTVDGLDIQYFPMMIKESRDIELILVRYGFLHEKDFAFIWDVRSANFSEMTNDQRRDVIINEAILLHEIMSSEWFKDQVRFYQVK